MGVALSRTTRSISGDGTNSIYREALRKWMSPNKVHSISGVGGFVTPGNINP